jgi:hypothetical protein
MYNAMPCADSGREFLYAERNKDKNHHPSENAERPVRTMTFFGNIKGHLEKFYSPRRCEYDSLIAMGNGRMERASHGADWLIR